MTENQTLVRYQHIWLRRWVSAVPNAFLVGLPLFLLVTFSLGTGTGLDVFAFYWSIGVASLLTALSTVPLEPNEKERQRLFFPELSGYPLLFFWMGAVVASLSTPLIHVVIFNSGDTIFAPLAYTGQLMLGVLCFLMYRRLLAWITAGLNVILRLIPAFRERMGTISPEVVSLMIWAGPILFLTISIVAGGRPDSALLTFSLLLFGATGAIRFRSVLSSLDTNVLICFLPLGATLTFFVYVVADDLFSGSPLSGQPEIGTYLDSFSFAGLTASVDIKYLVFFGAVSSALTIIVNLRQPLVDEVSDAADGTALSIFPDPEKYVDDDGHLARSTSLISRSNGGVIGITGLRGAGKSALLGATIDQFSTRYCTIWTVAPVSYQSEDQLSFLMSISRTICQKAIKDCENILYGRRGDVLRATEEFIRSIRPGLIIGALALVAFVATRDGGSNTNIPLLSARDTNTLPFSSKFSWGNTTFELKEITSKSWLSNIETQFQQTVAAERKAIAALVHRIDSVVPRSVQLVDAAPVENADGAQFAIVPIAERTGFDLIRGNENLIASGEFVKHHQWLSPEVSTPLSEVQVINIFDEGFTFGGLFTEIRPFQNIYQSGNLHSLARHIQLQLMHIRLITGETGLLNYSFGVFSPTGENHVLALAALRGHPNISLHLEAAAADMKSVLSPGRPGHPGVQPGELATVLLFAQYINALDAITNVRSTEDQKKKAVQDLFLSVSEISTLREILLRYFEILNGVTLNADVPDDITIQASPDGAATKAFKRLSAASRETLALLFLAFGIALLPEIWRWVNFILRGALNFKTLVLMRESSEFLELLTYSEGRERSGGLSFRGISIAGKRTLSARSMTLQSLTDRYQDYVDQLLRFYNGKLSVVIDELDKIADSEQVKSVLLELKGALFQPGCYYLISISEDAAKAFRGRLAEGRDIFESTFEDVLEIKQMATKTARKMVHKRIDAHQSEGNGNTETIPDDAIDVLTTFSGAIPREIVRQLRDTVLKEDKLASLTPRTVGLGIFQHELEQWNQQLISAPYAGQDLILMREKVDTILEALPTPETPQMPWPALPANEVSAALLLEECLTILDPEKISFSNDIASVSETIEKAEAGTVSTREFRRLSEIQACLRLMIINALMRYLWTHEELSPQQVASAVGCLRNVMIQPAVAKVELEILVRDGLGLGYPD